MFAVLAQDPPMKSLAGTFHAEFATITGNNGKNARAVCARLIERKFRHKVIWIVVWSRRFVAVTFPVCFEFFILLG